MRLDDGGTYLPSKAQLWTFEKWEDFWSRARAKRDKHNADLYALLNGDAHDGNHHGTTQIISGNEEVQAYIAQRTFGVVKDSKPEKIFVVRGTEAHVGPSGSSEENLARWLHAEKDPVTEAWSSWHWRLQIHGVLIDAQHHTSMGRLPWTMANAANRLAAEVFFEHARNRLPPPHLVFRSHVHRHADSYQAQPTRAIILPAWQLKTGYAHKVAPNSLADIGGGITVIYPDGTFEHETVLYRPDPPPVWNA